MDSDPLLRLGIFLGLFAALALWELRAPARDSRLPRAQRWSANLGLALVNTVLVRLVLPGSTVALAYFAEREGWGLLNHLALPGPLAMVAALVLLDLSMYLQHALFHTLPLLARLHAVHHADPEFDLTTGLRFHPLEMLVSTLLKLAVVAALGPAVAAVLVFEVLLNGAAMFNHANVSLPPWLEPWARRLVVTPDMHRIHHSMVERERNSNYGVVLSVWDRLLGSYTGAPALQLRIGLSDWRDERSIATLRGVLGMPFRRAH
jgi:sterol desaturase/sphingolipid hydroxylase (fatty acid hydroxylase superfamily)